MYRQGFNHRLAALAATARGIKELGSDVSVLEVLFQADAAFNVSFDTLAAVPEQDSWRYRTTRNGAPTTGRAMVCTVFSCNVLKAGGVFDAVGRDNVQCGEQTTWDIVSAALYDVKRIGANRPPSCVEADPDNELCQLMGDWTLRALPDFNSRGLYANMGNACPSKAPAFMRPSNC